MKYILILAGIFFSLTAFTQSLAQRFASSINADALKQHVDVLSSAEMEGRHTASEGEQKATRYIEEQFNRIGLKGATSAGYRMTFPVFKDSMTHSGIEVDGIKYKLNTDYSLSFTYHLKNDFAVPLIQNNHTGEFHFSEAVFAGYGIDAEKYSDYKNIDVVGKLVVVYEGEPSRDGAYLLSGSQKKSGRSFPFDKINTATKQGAAALLIIQKNFPLTEAPLPVSYLLKTPYQFYQGINAWYISEAIASAIFKNRYADIKEGIKNDTLQSIISPQVKISLGYSEKFVEQYGTNVLGILEGSDKKDEYIFISAHYDHLGIRNNKIYFGADDNASGTACLLSIAEAFAEAKKVGKGPSRSIVFAAFSGEENGLWGSYYYTINPFFSLSKTSVNINMDMMGRTGFDYMDNVDSTNYIYIVGNDKLSSDLLHLNERNNKNIKLKLDYKYNDLNDRNYFFYRSDHFNFADNGVPVLFYFNGEHADYHESTDTNDKINFSLMSRRARLVFYTAFEIAAMKGLLKRDVPLQKD